ncbi:MAG: SIMPL domain-containing protein, partial [Janthinobacterium lividum]
LPVAWRIGQTLEVTTTNLAMLPKTVAAAQQLLSLNGIHFGLTESSVKNADAQRIGAAYRSLTDRISAIAAAMGHNPADAVIDTIDFDASGAYAGNAAPAPMAMMRSAAMKESQQIEEPSFEPGETVLSMQVVGKVRFMQAGR